MSLTACLTSGRCGTTRGITQRLWIYLLEAEAIYLQTLGADHPTTQALQSWLAGTRAALGGQAE